MLDNGAVVVHCNMAEWTAPTKSNLSSRKWIQSEIECNPVLPMSLWLMITGDKYHQLRALSSLVMRRVPVMWPSHVTSSLSLLISANWLYVQPVYIAVKYCLVPLLRRFVAFHGESTEQSIVNYTMQAMNMTRFMIEQRWMFHGTTQFSISSLTWLTVHQNFPKYGKIWIVPTIWKCSKEILLFNLYNTTSEDVSSSCNNFIG